ncbi:MAG: DUF4367 domain-containing protein, partial [Candidatus Eremiobacteraeota bacterium]|nr:DUF4367 domain-containing protein [Candidatus Eremiobacteraeota bacterium]
RVEKGNRKMKHLETGELRRLLDEPESFSEQDQEHARTCARCADESRTLAADASFAREYFDGEPVRRGRSSRRGVAAALVALAAVLALAFFASPLGSYAKGFLTIFQPKQFTAVDVSTRDLHSFRDLAQLDSFGTHRIILVAKSHHVASWAEAQRSLDFKVRRPGALPAGIANAVTYDVHTPAQFDFTFSAAKARAFAARSKKRMAPLPANLDGTVLSLRIGSMLIAAYGRPPHMGGAEGRRARRTSGVASGDFVLVVQSRLPSVRSTGASLAELEEYMLASPGISPEFAARIRALGDLSQTLPIPYRPDKQTSTQVTVDGVSGLALGDNTGLGSGVIWQKDGVLYGVAGSLSQDAAIAIANGLH